MFLILALASAIGSGVLSNARKIRTALGTEEASQRSLIAGVHQIVKNLVQLGPQITDVGELRDLKGPERRFRARK